MAAGLGVNVEACRGPEGSFRAELLDLSVLSSTFVSGERKPFHSCSFYRLAVISCCKKFHKFKFRFIVVAFGDQQHLHPALSLF